MSNRTDNASLTYLQVSRAIPVTTGHTYLWVAARWYRTHPTAYVRQQRSNAAQRSGLSPANAGHSSVQTLTCTGISRRRRWQTSACPAAALTRAHAPARTGGVGASGVECLVLTPVPPRNQRTTRSPSVCMCNHVPVSTRLHIVVSDELLVKIDAARGPGQPRGDFIRRALVFALGHHLTQGERERLYGVGAVERALGDDTHGSGALEPADRRGVDAATHTRVSPSPTRAASVRGASEPSAPAEPLEDRPDAIEAAPNRKQGCPQHSRAGQVESRGRWYCKQPGCVAIVGSDGSWLTRPTTV